MTWAADERVDLTIVDDRGLPDPAVEAYGRWLQAGVELLLGPYSSGLTRRVATVVCDAGRLLWNHGGSADDLARPGLVTVAAPASTYFHGTVELANEKGLDRVLLVAGSGPFARSVAEGARRRGAELGMDAQLADLDEWRVSGRLHDTAVLIVGTFQEDVALVRSIRRRDLPMGLIGCVAAGIEAFGEQLGPLAEGAFGPTQWHPPAERPEVGPTATEFIRRYRTQHGEEPDYLSAQAAAAGHLAAEALRRGYGPDDVRRWQTSTLLGHFALDETWTQVGHRVATIQWRRGWQFRKK